MNDRPQPGSRYRAARREDRVVSSSTEAERSSAAWTARQSILRIVPMALGVAAGVLLVFIGFTLFSGRSSAVKSPSVDPVARQLCGDLTAQQYDDLYGLLASSEQSLGPKDQFIASQRQLDAQLGTARSCTYQVSGQDATGATLTLHLARGTSSAAPAPVRLTLQIGVWRIADFDSSLVVAPRRQFSRMES
ncbi:MAG TPA: hypothetical protein VFN11_18905 [Ktedonobacterales bacterium]|nr:hypothetical protein [Ktedonobacterales bacterium]